MEHYKKLADIKEDLDKGKINLPGLIVNYLRTIQKKSHLNAFLEVWGQEAEARAKEIQKKIESKTAGKLAGMVLAIKDNICYKGHNVSASSKILEGFTSLYSSTVVERILAEDAIIVGRLNCDEFAMGASNENSAYGPVLNDLDNTRVPGGSSGGAAVAVQANMCLAALGSDTGGSIRQPAALTGTFGLKPTYGRVSRWGLIAYASSFDIIGPITKSVEDAQILMEVISGADEYDATTSNKQVEEYRSTKADKKYRFAYIKEALELDGLQEEVRESTMQFITKLKEDGHSVEAVSLPELDALIPVYYTLTTAEASSNLARFAGMHYGYRSKQAKDLETTIKKSRSEGFGPEVKRRIMLGTFVLSVGYYDAYYTKAQKVRKVVAERTREILNNYDFILSPTSPSTAFKLGEKASNPLAMYLADILTVHANIAGIPALSFPFGRDKDGLPIGMQLCANHFEEGKLLAFVKNLVPTT